MNFLKQNWLRTLISALFAGSFSAIVAVEVTTIGGIIGVLVFFAFLFMLFYVVAGMQFPEP